KKEKVAGDDKTVISVGNWPKENNPVQAENFKKYVGIMKEKYPNITVTPDQWSYDVNSFLSKAASDQLPTVYNTHFTEPKKIVEAGYAKDITEAIKKHGYADKINKDMLDLVTIDGKYYGLPAEGYLMGLCYNANLFKEAGIVDEKGLPKYPKTFEELALTAKEIKDKTGKAGFAFQTTKNQGGWLFMNIAWGFGAEFEKKNENKWIATFNSPEGVEALQYVKDLKWKYNVWTDNVLLDTPDVAKKFAMNELAMTFDSSAAITNSVSVDYGMDLKNVGMASMPAGPKGKKALLGGTLRMIAPDATDEEVDAVFKWLEVTGYTPSITDDLKNRISESLAAQKDKKQVVFGYKGENDVTTPWSGKEHVDLYNSIAKDYCTVNMSMFDDYLNNKDVEPKAEVPMCAQELYKILDSAIQEVLSNEKAEPKNILDKAADDFQTDYLDKLQ
ncbi:MAG: extracellular solute-binding protein, partial [Oscillospiraceae bacterium]